MYHIFNFIDLSCVCAPGSIRVPGVVVAGRAPSAYLSSFHPTCAVCGAGTAPSADQRLCLSCSGNMQAIDGKCKCDEEISYLKEDIASDGLSGSFSCTACQGDTYPWTGGKCEPCPDRMVYSLGKCECDTQYSVAGDICVPRDGDPELQVAMKYENVEAGGQSRGAVTIGSSDTLVQLQRKAAHLCRTTLAAGAPDQQQC